MVQRLNIVLATGNEQIDKIVIENKNLNGLDTSQTGIAYTVQSIVSYKADIIASCHDDTDVILIAPWLEGKGSIEEIILNLHNARPKLRIIYLYGKVDKTKDIEMMRLGALTSSGIYDIYTEPRLKVNGLIDILTNPRKAEDVSELSYVFNKKDEKINKLIIDCEEKENTQSIEGFDNVICFSSIKPGTGKSFTAVNVATCIAKFGLLPESNKEPNVLIIEGDLQNLTVGTILKIENNEKNLKTVMDKINTVIDQNGNIIGSPKQIAEVDDFIKDSLIRHKDIKNLYALTGSQLSLGECANIKSIHYEYLIERVKDRFDFIIIDTNSSLQQETTYPFLKMSKVAYYILNLDINNIRNNVRYQDTLKNEFKVFNKVKYILNEDIPDEMSSDSAEVLVFGANELDKFQLHCEAKIPIIDKIVFLNSQLAGTPIILDNRDNTIKARLELSKIANQICPISNIKKLEESYRYYIESLKKQKKRFRFW